MTTPPPADSPRVELYTDGACKGNPGPGGWAFILRHPDSGKELEQSGAEPQSTNNRMELTAVIEGLQTLKRPSHVDLYTDSEYVGKGISQWLAKWKKDGWRRGNSPLKNVDLWRALDQQLGRHLVTYHRVLGHTGHPENERCDQLAVAAYQRLLEG
jgi:ribonuclease HI